MATVIYGWLAWKSQTPVMWIVAVLGITLVGLSRVFACSRFIHQVMLHVSAQGFCFHIPFNCRCFHFSFYFHHFTVNHSTPYKFKFKIVNRTTEFFSHFNVL